MKKSNLIMEEFDPSKKIRVGEYIQTSLHRQPEEIKEVYMLDTPGDYDENKCQKAQYVTYQQVNDGYVCMYACWFELGKISSNKIKYSFRR